MINLSPSILSADFACLGQECRTVLDAGARMLHFDVMDGHFVPNISYGAPVLKSLHAALPDVVFDVHLMITDPVRYAPDFAKAGAGILTFHIEAVEDPAAAIAAIRALGCGVGMSVKPGTPVESLYPYLDDLALVLVMSVEPGFGGQAFMPVALDKLRAVRAECDRRGLNPWLEVDGGINAETGAACVQAGANLLVAGNSVFGASDPAAAVAALCAL